MPAGYTIRTPITRQVQKERGDSFKMAGQLFTLVVMLVMIVMFIATLSVSGNLVPIYGLFETLQLIVHMPLVSINLPGSVTQFIMPIADLI